MKELLKNRSFIYVWAAQGASGLGHTFSAFILSWLVYEMTGSKVAMGGIWIAFMVPNLAVQLLSGPYLDRWNRRFLMIFSEWVRAMAYLSAAALYPLGLLELWHLYTIAIVSGLVEPLFRASSMAYIAEILPRNYLMRGNSILEGTMNILMLTGPALGGAIVTVAGAGYVLASLVVVLGLAGFLLCLIRDARRGTVPAKESWFVQFRQGLKFFQVYTVLFWIGAILMVINSCSGAAQPMFLPFVTEELGGTAFHYGLFTSTFSVGMILGSIWAGIRNEPRDRRKVMLGALLVSGLLLGSLGWVRAYPLAMLLTAGSGFCSMMFTINNTTFYQKRVPDELRGRVFAVRILMAQVGVPVGAALGAVFAELWGIRLLFIVLGAVMTLTMAAAWFSPVFYKLNDQEPLPAEGEAHKFAAPG